MSDISKCSGERGMNQDFAGDICPNRQKCWRYLAPVSRAQSWIAPPWDDEACRAWIPEPKRDP